MDKNYKILISCYSGEKDSGDETMLLCIREQLEKTLDKDIIIKAFSNNPQISYQFNDNIEFIYSGRHGIKQPECQGVHSFKWLKEMINAIKECDILITGGGTILYDESTAFFVPFWFLKIIIAQFYRKPTVFYGIGVGPINRLISKYLLNIFGRRMNFISLRGVESEKWMKKFRVPASKVYLTADPAMTISPADSKKIDQYLASEGIFLNPHDDFVVIVLREWFARKNRGLEQAQNGVSKISSYSDYIEQLSEFCKYLIQVDKSNIIFMPMGSLPPCDDRIVMNDVYNRLKDKNVNVKSVFQMSDITDSRIMVGIMGRAKAVITGRFHGLVYATTQYIPAIGIAYTEKYYDYYNYIGLSEYVINMNDLTFELLREKYVQLLENQTSFVDKLKTEIPNQINRAMKNAELVAQILKNRRK